MSQKMGNDSKGFIFKILWQKLFKYLKSIFNQSNNIHEMFFFHLVKILILVEKMDKSVFSDRALIVQNTYLVIILLFFFCERNKVSSLLDKYMRYSDAEIIEYHAI